MMGQCIVGVPVCFASVPLVSQKCPRATLLFQHVGRLCPIGVCCESVFPWQKSKKGSWKTVPGGEETHKRHNFLLWNEWLIYCERVEVSREEMVLPGFLSVFF